MLSPELDAIISGKVSAGGDISLSSRFNRNADGTLVAKGADAAATTASGSLLGSLSGAVADAEVGAKLETAVLAGALLSAGGAVSLKSYGNEDALADAGGVAISGGLSVGATLVDATIKGQVLTHFDGKLESGASLALEGKVDTKASATGTAVGGAILAAGNGTSADATIEPEVRTTIGGAADITVSGDVTLDTQILTEADALASAVTVAGLVGIGATPASATIDSTAETAVRGGAKVTSTGGDIMLTAANNFADGKFLTGKGANVSTNMTTGAGVAISESNLTADAQAEVIAQIGANATLSAAGNVSVDARSSNFAEARTKTVGGGLVSVDGSTPEATAGGATRAKMLGNVVATQNIVVTAQSSDIAAAGASATTGGAIRVGSSTVDAKASPNVEATVGGQSSASGNITVQALSTTDADASSRSVGGGAVSVTTLHANASATPNVNAGVAAASVIKAGDTLTISALHGANPTPTADGSFAPAAVNTTSNTIDLGARHGLLTGDTVTYQAGAAALNGLTDGRQYGVIYVTDNALQLGAAFTATTNSVNLERDEIHFTGAHNLQSGDRVIFHADQFGVGGLTEGATYIVNVINASTIKLASALLAAQTFTGAQVDDVTDTITVASGHGSVDGQAVTFPARRQQPNSTAPRRTSSAAATIRSPPPTTTTFTWAPATGLFPATR